MYGSKGKEVLSFTREGFLDEPMEKIHTHQGFTMFFPCGVVSLVEDEATYLDMFDFNKKTKKVVRHRNMKRKLSTNEVVVVSTKTMMLNARENDPMVIASSNVAIIEVSLYKVYEVIMRAYH